MKKIITIISLAFLCLTGSIKAQITLQFTFDSVNIKNPFFPYCTDIGNNEYKYLTVNLVQNSFSLYNMDMSPYMTNIQIPSTGDSLKNGFSVIYITKSLFDCDSTNIEYVFENPTDASKPFRIYRTDGTLLLQVDSANGPYGYGGYLGGSMVQSPIINTSSGAKLFLQRQCPNHIANGLVYSLCGNLPESVYNFPGNGNYVKIYPNPASMLLNFEVNAPNNQEEFDLVIFDATGKEYNRVNIDATQNKYALDVSKLSSGTYIYSLTTKDKAYQTGKFVITK